MSDIKHKNEINSPENKNDKPIEYNQNPEERKKQKNALDQNDNIGETGENKPSSTDYASRIKSLGEMEKKSTMGHDYLRDKLDENKSLSKKDAITAHKLFEENKSALDDVKSIRADIEKDQEALLKKQSELDGNDPDYRSKRNALGKEYNDLETYKNKLSNHESNLLRNADVHDYIEPSDRVKALQEKSNDAKEDVDSLRRKYNKTFYASPDDISSASKKNESALRDSQDIRSDIKARRSEINKELKTLGDGKEDKAKKRELINELEDLSDCEAKLGKCEKTLQQNRDALKDISYNGSFDLSDKISSLEKKKNESGELSDSFKEKREKSKEYTDNDREKASKAIEKNKDILGEIEKAQLDIEKKQDNLDKNDVEYNEKNEYLESCKEKLENCKNKLEYDNKTFKDVYYGSLEVSDKMKAIEDKAQKSSNILDSLNKNHRKHQDLSEDKKDADKAINEKKSTDVSSAGTDAGEKDKYEGLSPEQLVDEAGRLEKELSEKLRSLDNQEGIKLIGEYRAQISELFAAAEKKSDMAVELENKDSNENHDGVKKSNVDSKEYYNETDHATAKKQLEKNKETLNDISSLKIEIGNKLVSLYTEKSHLDIDNRGDRKKLKKINKEIGELEADNKKLTELEENLQKENESLKKITKSAEISQDLIAGLKNVGENAKNIRSRYEDLLSKRNNEDKNEGDRTLNSIYIQQNEVSDLKRDVAERRAEALDAILEMRKEGEISDKEKYKGLCEEYNFLDSAYNKLNALEGDLEGLNYADSEMFGFEYLQQSDNFRYSGSVSDYVDALEKKINSGETSAADRILADFQKNNVYDALTSSLEKNGAKEKEEAENLLARFENCREFLASKHGNVRVEDDGNVFNVEAKEKAFGCFGSSRTEKMADGEKTTNKQWTALKANLEYKNEISLNSGRSFGRAEVEGKITIGETKRTDITRRLDDNGNEIFKQTRTEAYKAFELGGNASGNVKEGQASISTDAKVGIAELLYETKRGDVIERQSATIIGAQAQAGLNFDAKKHSGDAVASYNVGSGEIKGSKSIGGDKLSTEVHVNAFGGGVSVGMSEQGVSANKEHYKAQVKAKMKLNDETLFRAETDILALKKKPDAPKTKDLVDNFKKGVEKLITAKNIMIDHKRVEGNANEAKGKDVERYNDQAERDTKRARAKALDENRAIGKALDSFRNTDNPPTKDIDIFDRKFDIDDFIKNSSKEILQSTAYSLLKEKEEKIDKAKTQEDAYGIIKGINDKYDPVLLKLNNAANEIYDFDVAEGREFHTSLGVAEKMRRLIDPEGEINKRIYHASDLVKEMEGELKKASTPQEAPNIINAYLPEINKLFDEAHNIQANYGNLSREYRLNEAHKLEEYKKNNFSSESSTVVRNVPVSMEYLNDSDKLHIDFPGNEGLVHARPITISNLPSVLTRYGSAADGGVNYSELKPNGELYTDKEIAIPYVQNSAKQSVFNVNTDRYYTVVDALAEDVKIDIKTSDKNITTVFPQLMNPNLSPKERDEFSKSYAELKNEYAYYLERYGQVKDDGGKLLTVDDPDAIKYGVMGKAAKIDDVYTGGAPQYNLPLKNDSLRMLGILDSNTSYIDSKLLEEMKKHYNG